MAKKKKFYVVWVGREPGIYDNWEDCAKQVNQYPNAKYKAFDSLEQAKIAFEKSPVDYIHEGTGKDKVKQTRPHATGYIKEAVAVDASAQGNPGIMEYRGVDLKTGKQIFRVGKFYDATNNIGEFLAIVHALAYLKKQGKNWPVYSDSAIAIKWVKEKKCKTKLQPTSRNKKVFELIQRAEKWLRENDYINPILKWDTKKWGEIPADFGRK